MTESRHDDPISIFRRPESTDAETCECDRAEAMRLFFRMNDGMRLDLLGQLMAAWLDDEQLNRHMVGAVFRDAWDSEPYIDGMRAGSYFTALALRTAGGPIWLLGEVAEHWGGFMMTGDERERLDAMQFPLTVYRGGTARSDDLAAGVSWTLKRETAEFYAHKWPRRLGDAREGLVLTVTVDRDEVAGFHDERDEAEVLLPSIGHRIREMVRLGKAE